MSTLLINEAEKHGWIAEIIVSNLKFIHKYQRLISVDRTNYQTFEKTYYSINLQYQNGDLLSLDFKTNMGKRDKIFNLLVTEKREAFEKSQRGEEYDHPLMKM